MAHVLVDVAARVIPEKPPVDVPVRIELALRRLAQKRLPNDVLAGHVRIDWPRPLRLPMRRVAVHMRVNAGDLSDKTRGEETGSVGDLPGGARLMPNLHGLLGGLLIGGPHPL